MEGSRELKQYPELQFLLDLKENCPVRELREPWRALRALNAAGVNYWGGEGRSFEVNVP